MVDRHEKIAAILARKGYRSVAELSEDLGVSEMTIRRDLEKLEQKGLIKRTYGGAYTGQEIIEVDYRVRETIRQQEKEIIGKKASSLIQPGESIFIDTGSTAAFLASAIDDTKRITVVTNSLVVAQTLETRTNVETIVLGGKIHRATHSLTGHLAEDAVKQFKFTKAFIGVSGINLNEGLAQSTLEEIQVKKLVIANSRQVIVLADSSKFNKDVLVIFSDFSRVDTIITDNGVQRDDVDILNEKGIKVIIADATAPL